MQIQTNRPIQSTINSIYTRYADSPINIIKDTGMAVAFCATFKYIAIPAATACIKQVGKRVVPILQSKVTYYVTATLTTCWLAYKYSTDDTPPSRQIQINRLPGQTPASPLNTWL